MRQRFEQTDKIDVDIAWLSWLQFYDDTVKACVPEITIRKSNLPPWFNSEVRRLKIKKKQAWTKATKFNRAHHWEKFRNVRK